MKLDIYGNLAKATKKQAIFGKLLQPNHIMEDGLINRKTDALPAQKIPAHVGKIDMNTQYDATYQSETGRGPIFIPVYKNGYMGEPV